MTAGEGDGSGRAGKPPTDRAPRIEASGTDGAKASGVQSDRDGQALRRATFPPARSTPASGDDSLVTGSGSDGQIEKAYGSQEAGPTEGSRLRAPQQPRHASTAPSPKASARPLAGDPVPHPMGAAPYTGLGDPWHAGPGERRPPAPRALFLARDRYRQRRVRDIARMMPAAAALLWLIPLLWRSSTGDGGNGTAFTSVFLFAAWAALIVAAALIARRIEIEDLDTAPSPKADPDERSATQDAP